MMPKEALTDRAIRNEVIPGLPLSTICELLTRFRPDELAQEPLQPGDHVKRLWQHLLNAHPKYSDPEGHSCLMLAF